MIDENTTLPEGTDTIITGASAPSAEPIGDSFTTIPSEEDAVLEDSTATTGSKAGDAFRSARDTLKDETENLRAQASDKFRAYAAQGKDRTTDALDNVITLINDAANTVEEKLGPQYASYARSAAGSISGVADTLRSKDVEELVEDAKALIRSSPAIAIGTAAVLGFALARVLKASSPAEGSTGDA